uniref:MalY/PatB family protein n=1 Tax=Herbidospora sakaeratensis TaxID=564415 RepID=UPI0007810093|nr:aminotransferase class I/II-fold pyridoxal phosphate-dependent enzyme [Herbidospora sakaeratensis]
MDFDQLTVEQARKRDGTKWTQAEGDVIPAWVADMDFPVAGPIRDAIMHRVTTDMGYPDWPWEQPGLPLPEVFAERMAARYGFHPDPVHVRTFTDLNQSLQALLDVLTEPGEGVLTHTPTYNAFLMTLEAMNRPPVPIPLVPDGESWRAELPADPRGARVLLLVNPHNPTGRCFTRTELEEIAEYADRHDLTVISDEIHCDLVFAPHEHIPFGLLRPKRTVTITSASKAFNMGGLHCAIAHVGSARAREALATRPPALYGQPSVLGVAATVAAWRECDAWLDGVVAVLDRNRKTLAQRLPAGWSYRVPEATYLAWIDTGIPDAAAFLEREARVKVAPGSIYGASDSWIRLNFGTSGPILEEILDRIRG